MEIKNLTTNQLNRLKLYELPKTITSIECQLYLYKHLDKTMLLKKYYRNDDSKYMGNKFLTISLLNHYKDEINIPQLILPEQLVSVDKVISGFIMPFIPNNTNLSLILYDKFIETKEKIKHLRSCEQIIQSVHHVKAIEGFLLGDIHESNFIYNHDDNKIYAVDLDGCKIGNNQIHSMKYGSFNEKLYGFEKKYPLDYDDNPICNINTEWYCYSMMVLNTIGQGNVHRLLINDFYDYIQFLRENGVGKELVDYFCNLYSYKSNVSPAPLLNEIPDDISKFDVNEFAKQKKLTYM